MPFSNVFFDLKSIQYHQDLDLLICRCQSTFLHLLSLVHDQLAVVHLHLDISGGRSSTIYHIVMTEDNKLLVGTNSGLTVVKLISN